MPVVPRPALKLTWPTQRKRCRHIQSRPRSIEAAFRLPLSHSSSHFCLTLVYTFLSLSLSLSLSRSLLLCSASSFSYIDSRKLARLLQTFPIRRVIVSGISRNPFTRPLHGSHRVPTLWILLFVSLYRLCPDPSASVRIPCSVSFFARTYPEGLPSFIYFLPSFLPPSLPLLF